MNTPIHNPGGKRSFPVHEGIRAGALISECGRYRLLLWREWGEPDNPPTALWIGMYPSTATAEVDVPTIIREIGFTRRFGLRRYVKTNIMDYRSTDPKALSRPGVFPCSTDNLAMIRRAAEDATIIILAHGKIPKPLARFANEVVAALQQDRRELWAVGLNKDGSPKHPLYVRADAPLIRL